MDPISFLRNAFHRVYAILDHFTKPTSTFIKNKQEIELAHHRNKAFATIHILAALQFFIKLLLGIGKIEANLYGMVGTLLVVVMMLVTLHLKMHHQCFNVFYNIYIIFFALLQKECQEHGIFSTWLAVPMFPIFVYYITGSIAHFAVHALCQSFLMNTFYQGLMKKDVMFMSVEDVTYYLTHHTNESLSYCVLYTVLIHFTLKNAVQRIQIAEKQKEDLERQRNFLLSFSHELRNLINSLMGNVKLASLEKLTERVKDLLLNAEVCSELLLHLVNNILDTGKVEIGDLEINPVSTKIYDTIERIWGVCSELIKRKNLSGRVKLQKDIPQVLVFDHYRVTQIFFNLVGNAIKFTDSGHININVEWIPGKEQVDDKCFEPHPFNEIDERDEGLFEKNQALSVLHENFGMLNFTRKKVERNTLATKTDLKKGILKISVIDTGSGIIKEDISKLFQRFQQGTSDPAKRKLGTGLGLFITKELCRRMQGDVRVFSKPGVGSVFTFCLPIEPATDLYDEYTPHTEGLQKNMQYASRKVKAMVVDDEQFSQSVLRDFLRLLNVEVTDTAENGLIAYRKVVERIAQGEYFDMVTMDINMSIMDGKIAAQKIRELEAEKKLKPCLLVMVSGNCGEAEIAECLEKKGKIRANAFIKKPVRIEELSSIIADYTRISRKRGNQRRLDD